MSADGLTQADDVLFMIIYYLTQRGDYGAHPLSRYWHLESSWQEEPGQQFAVFLEYLKDCKKLATPAALHGGGGFKCH